MDNGLSKTDLADIEQLRTAISVIIVDVGSMGRHRSYSLAITKLDEARHWLKDRLDRTSDG